MRILVLQRCVLTRGRYCRRSLHGVVIVFVSFFLSFFLLRCLSVCALDDSWNLDVPRRILLAGWVP